MNTIAVASGKGGVGKTTLTANLGVALARKNKRVVLFDADLGLADLDVMLGVKAEASVQDAIDGVVGLREVMVEGPAGVKLIPGSSGVAKMMRLSRKRLEGFLEELTDLSKDTDYLIFDASAGADARVVTFMRAADSVLLVATPDPASITDAYATIKVLHRYQRDANVRVLVNMAENEQQGAKVFDVIQSIATKFLKKDLTYAGCVRYDPLAVQMVRQRKSFMESAPMSPASCDLRKVAESLVSAFQGSRGSENIGRLLEGESAA